MLSSAPRADNFPDRSRWINYLLSNLKTSFSGTFHAFNFDNYAKHYLGCFCLRLNRRCKMTEKTERIANAICSCGPCHERDLRVAELYGQSSREIDCSKTGPQLSHCGSCMTFRQSPTRFLKVLEA